MQWHLWDEKSPVCNVSIFIYDEINDRFAIGYMEDNGVTEVMQVRDAKELMIDFYTTHWSYPERPIKER
jgi:ATP:corrinoid adenosyltransferase